jgi:hypothetical protein
VDVQYTDTNSTVLTEILTLEPNTIFDSVLTDTNEVFYYNATTSQAIATMMTVSVSLAWENASWLRLNDKTVPNESLSMPLIYEKLEEHQSSSIQVYSIALFLDHFRICPSRVSTI